MQTPKHIQALILLQYRKKGIHKFLLLILCWFAFASISQLSFSLTTVPFVTGYLRDDYGAARQNWNIAQDSRGIMYFANNDGLLQYDGNTWQLFRMPNKMGLRAVAIDRDDRIYTGTYEEFGYWETQPDGNLTYYSLSGKVANYRFNNDEIWRIIIVDNKVYFQSFGTYFTFDGNTVTQHNMPEAVLFFIRLPAMTIVQGMNSGIFRISRDTLTMIPNSEKLKNALIRAAVQLDSNRIILGTASEGLFLYEIRESRFTRWKTGADEILKSGQINCGTMAADSVLCFGTIGRGIVAIDRAGHLLWHFYKDYDLTTNTVLYLYTDIQNNIWAALDKGIAMIQVSSPFRSVRPGLDNIELVYTAVKHNQSLYIGTNQGVFRLSENPREAYSFLPGTQGQVWELTVIDNQLICGHNEGTFRIVDNKVIPVSSITGGTSIKPYTYNGNNCLVQSTYGAIVVYKKDDHGNWIYDYVVQGFSHPVRYLEIDHLGYIWASHFIKGLYRIKLDSDVTKAIEVKTFGTNSGLPVDTRINVFKISGRVVFCTGSLFYTYDDLTDQLVPYDWLNGQLGEFAAAHRVIQTGENLYWLVGQDKFAEIMIDNDHVRFMNIIPFSMLKNNLIDKNEYLTTLDDHQVLFCLENGLAVYDRNVKSHPGKFTPQLLFRQVKVSSNRESMLLPVKTSDKSKVVIPYGYRRIMFTFAFPDFSGREVTLNCMLRSRREELADTVTRQLITYAFLEPGQYRLKVIALDENKAELGSGVYYFAVKPPFYATAYAYLLYMLLLILVAYFTWKGVKRHIKLQNEKVRHEQEKLQQERIERREQKIILLKNEKLEDELRHKSKELASSTMAIIRKNEMLLQLKKEVEAQKQKLGSQYPNKYVDRLIRMINENISSDDDWEIFQQNFDLIHENFFRNIKGQYPEMTAHDLKLCAFIHLNLSTKEIASLLNITVRGVEAARYRLRKKFGIPAEKNLTEFLIEFK
jgi:hypothetical protein